MADPQEVKPADIISELKAEGGTRAPLDADDWYEELEDLSTQTRTMEDEENQGILIMRKWWAYVVLGLITLIVLFDFLLVYKFGTRQWQFDNPTVVVVVITDNFLKIFGLGFLITKEIFRKIFR
jgi:hypothetical protein